MKYVRFPKRWICYRQRWQGLAPTWEVCLCDIPGFQLGRHSEAWHLTRVQLCRPQVYEFQCPYPQEQEYTLEKVLGLFSWPERTAFPWVASLSFPFSSGAFRAWADWPWVTNHGYYGWHKRDIFGAPRSHARLTDPVRTSIWPLDDLVIWFYLLKMYLKITKQTNKKPCYLFFLTPRLCINTI